MAKIAFAVFLLLAVAVLSANVIDGCSGDEWNNLAQHCTKFVGKGRAVAFPPSADCCDAIASANVTCACQHVTNDLIKLIDMDRVVKVAAYCKHPLQPCSKCGVYTVPCPPRFS